MTTEPFEFSGRPGETRRRGAAPQQTDTLPNGARTSRRTSRTRFNAASGSQQSQRASDRYRLLFETNVAGTFRATPQGRIVDCNSAFARLLGYESCEQVLASGGPCPLPPDWDLRRLCRASFLRNLTVRGSRRDGTPFEAVENLAWLPPQGSARAEIEGTLVEIGRRDAETMGLLTRGVIHDVNNLLTAVLGECELLAPGVSKDARVQKLFESVKRAGEWAASLTAELLAADGRRPTATELLDLNDLLAGMEPTLRSLLGDRIRLSFVLNAGRSHVLASPLEMGRVVLNLALNARDAMPNGGTLSVQTSAANVAEAGQDSATAAGDCVQLAISDTGLGMDGATAERIFEPYFTTKRNGRGLGLAAVREIVTRAGGSIRVESQPAAGTTFSICLPLAAKTAPSGEQQIARRAARILLVEDEPLLREMARRTLESCGHTVLATSSACEATRMVMDERDSIDLIVTDLALPGMGGRELAGRLRALRPEIKVLFTSGYSRDLCDCNIKEEDRFLPKPFKPATLAQAVDEALA